MKDEWIDMTRVNIPAIENEGKNERIIIREYIPPIKAEAPVPDEGETVLNPIPEEEEATVLLSTPGDDEATVLLQQSRTLAFVKRIKNNDFVIINKDEFILGKGNSCDYIITDNPTISRQHAKITKRNGEYYLEDLNSLNHTLVDNEQIHEPVLLSDEFKFNLSDEEFQFFLTQEDL